MAIVFLLSVLGFHYLGEHSWLEAVWLVVVTISTVGYAENTNSSPALQIFTIFVIVLGVSAGAYTVGGLIQLMLEGEVDRVLGKRKMTKDLNCLKDHVIICGFGRLGEDLGKQLKHRGIPFIVVDSAADKVAAARSDDILALQGDATSEDVIRELKLDQARALATALPTDAENVFITLTARNLKPDIQIIAKAEREDSCRKLRQAGANKIVMPHRVGAQQMERMISRPSTADLVELFAEASQLDMELDEIHVAADSQLVGSTLAESRIKDDYSLLVLGISDSQGNFRFNPKPQETIRAQDTLLVIGDVEEINRLKEANED